MDGKEPVGVASACAYRPKCNMKLQRGEKTIRGVFFFFCFVGIAKHLAANYKAQPTYKHRERFTLTSLLHHENLEISTKTRNKANAMSSYVLDIHFYSCRQPAHFTPSYLVVV